MKKDYLNFRFCAITYLQAKARHLLFLFLVLSFSQFVRAQQHITMSMANCQAIGTNQLQFDVIVLNDGAVPIKFNSAVIRFSHGNISTGTISWGPVNSAWPGWTNAGTYTYNASTQICSFSSGTAFFASSAVAPNLPINVPVTLGRFYIQTSTTFTSNVSSQLTWVNTAGIAAWVNGSPTTSSLNTTTYRTLATPCNIPLNPTGQCPTSVNVSTTSPICVNGYGSAQVSLLPANAIPSGIYSVNGGASVSYTSNQFNINSQAAGTYTITVSASGCAPVSTTYTMGNGTSPQPTNTTTQTACASYTWPVNGTTYTTSGTYTSSSVNSSNCVVLETLNLTIVPGPGHLELATSGNTSSIVGTLVLSNNLNNSNVVLFGSGCNYTATVSDATSGLGMGLTQLTTTVDATLPLINTQIYCPRHFTVNATNNEAGSITFYVAQDDFNDYNAASGSFLPMNATTLKLHQVTNGGATIVSLPTTILWNASLNRYEITCGANFINGDYYFYTDMPCIGTVLSPTVSAITSTSVNVSWPAVSGGVSYHLRYRVVGTTAWNNAGGTSSSMVLSGLQANTTYEYQVRVVCGPGQYGPWNSLNYFTTLVNSCQAPSAPVVSNIGTSSAYFSWPNLIGATYYIIRYRPITNPASSWITASMVTNPWLQLNSLAPSMTYQVQVAEWCAAGSILSPFSPATSFTTLGISSCAVPTVLTASYTSTTANLSWNAILGASLYNVRYRITPLGAWNVTTSPVNNKFVNNLLPVTNYEFQVRAYCSSISNYSAWSVLYPFTTPLKPPHSNGGNYYTVNNTDGNSTQIYPNPTSSNLTLDYTMMEQGQLRYQLVDATGRIVFNKVVEVSDKFYHEEIDMHAFSQGIYHFQLFENGKLSYQEKVIKQ